ncbi:TPA: hypothetical protein KCY13_004725 [Escherichia coli]|nr:hypothetical protein [Escherichia coli]
MGSTIQVLKAEAAGCYWNGREAERKKPGQSGLVSLGGSIIVYITAAQRATIAINTVAAITVFPILADFISDFVLGQIIKFTPRHCDQFILIRGRNASKVAVNIRAQAALIQFINQAAAWLLFARKNFTLATKIFRDLLKGL